jgi:hypothetical protein
VNQKSVHDLVELFSNSKIEDRLNPVGPLYYTDSCLICCAHAILESYKLVLSEQGMRA